jgi:hypothetical protein
MTNPTYQESIVFLQQQLDACLAEWMHEESPELSSLQMLKDHIRYLEEEELHQTLEHILNVMRTCPGITTLDADLGRSQCPWDDPWAASLCRWASLLSEWLILRRGREDWDYANIEW